MLSLSIYKLYILYIPPEWEPKISVWTKLPLDTDLESVTYRDLGL